MTAKIGILDIETTPNIAHVWGLWRQSVFGEQLRESGRIIMWGGKIWREPGVRLMDEHADGYEEMIRGLHAYIQECDIIVAHNGDKFDMRWANAEFARLGLAPPDPAKTVDTLKVAKKNFYFPSYKLDYLVKEFGLGAKVKHEGHELWVGWMVGDPSATEKMRTYCKHDVVLEERLYKYFRPWITNHPNMGAYVNPGRPTCPNCGSTKVVKKGRETTNTGSYQRYRCKSCKTPLRSRFLDTPVEERRHILRSAR